MAVYLFSFHAYRSWMPDRDRGFVRKRRGIQPPDPGLAAAYRARATGPETVFDAAVQRAIIEAAQAFCGAKACRLHQIVVTPNHVHALVSWRGYRRWEQVRRSLRYGLTVELRRRFGAATRFSEGGSRRRVRDMAHFRHLMDTYLPRHYRYGAHWRESGA